eukprot:CAMPEP_0183703710 /NCGR_PEP_ID=MMETSP0737-20130205/1353_1 /TAXON_ID=385413 /ORGANISM="Thalassiosira miniscula, Strain CCMP1093" /LENGTH=1131 /DNA_ID=CAMNT_0025930507 /DNA_START=86 /DNA_END=3481 /DNA_ORIENTATION=-
MITSTRHQEEDRRRRRSSISARNSSVMSISLPRISLPSLPLAAALLLLTVTTAVVDARSTTRPISSFRHSPANNYRGRNNGAAAAGFVSNPSLLSSALSSSRIATATASSRAYYNDKCISAPTILFGGQSLRSRRSFVRFTSSTSLGSTPEANSSSDQDNTSTATVASVAATTIESTSIIEGDIDDATNEASETPNGKEKEQNTSTTPDLSTTAEVNEELNNDDEYFDQMFENLTHPESESNSDDDQEEVEGDVEEGHVKLVDFIEQSVGIQETKTIRGRTKKRKEKNIVTSAFSVEGKKDIIKAKDNIKTESDEGEEASSTKNKEEPTKTMDYSASNEFTMASEIAHPPEETSKPLKSSHQLVCTTAAIMEDLPPPSVNEKKEAPYNVVCTHITADFDTLASAIGLAKLWSLGLYDKSIDETDTDGIVNGPLPTYVVLPRGAHPDVQRFLSLHKHLFPIRSLKSLPGFSDNDIKKRGKNNGNNKNKNNNNNMDSNNEYKKNEGLQRVGLVDAQRRDRLGPAEILLPHAKLGVTIVDHHVDAESDIQEARNYVVENVGSVSTMIAERIKSKGIELTEAEATILALGIHSDTGSLVYDSTTPKDASMLGWAMEMGASQTAIAEHAKPTLSDEQQGVLTQSLVNINSTAVHGVTISTVLLSADGFIPGLASVTKDALDLSSSDVFLLAVCYEATRGAKGGGGGGKSNGKKGKKKKNNNDDDKSKNAGGAKLSKDASERLKQAKIKTVKALSSRDEDFITVKDVPSILPGVGSGLSSGSEMINSDSWKGGEIAFQRQRLAATFAFYDTDRSGFLEKDEIYQALTSAGFVISSENFDALISSIDTNGDGKIDFEEFVYFYTDMEEQRKWEALRDEIEGKLPNTASTMTIIGRVKAGVNVRNVNLNTLFQKFNGGGHPKAASATVKLENESEAKGVLQGLVDELIDASLEQQLTVGDFMQSPVLSARPTMTEKQVEDLFIRYDVRALPVVDDDNKVMGLVSYKEVAAAKMRLMNKQEKRMRQIEKAAEQGKPLPEARPLESALKGWMKQHVQTVKASLTMAEVENILLETDVGCIPVVADDSNQLIGMVTRTDLLRQHHYYSSLHYHNKGFSDSIAARKPIIELRKKLKKFDIENE